MKAISCWPMMLVFLFIFPIGVLGQKFRPDDPLLKDPDNLPIAMPAKVELSITYDTIENTFGFKDSGVLLRAQDINSLGEVPDSSWFTNRIGIRDMTLEELARGAGNGKGPDTAHTLTVVGAGLYSFTEGVIVRDSRGDEYYLIFDPVGMADMATGAAVVSNKFFYAAGYNVLPAYIALIDPDNIVIAPDAVISMLGKAQAPLDREFWDLFIENKQRRKDGKYRAAAYYIPRGGESIGEFKFYGTRSDDPNDIVRHENRRELRGMGVFASWLNHYHYRSINTDDRYETTDGRSSVRHYLIDFSTSLGSGSDLDGNLVPKDKQSGNEYVLWGSGSATLKTALSLGIWMRPWMKVQYPYPKYPGIGRFEADFFQPEKWKPEYPNPAYIRMLPDDAFWATKILARFSDAAIRAIVRTGEYSDPAAENYLVETLIKRRDKIIAQYYKNINPLDGFSVKKRYLEFKNLGVEAGLASDVYYEYFWYTFDNRSEALDIITERAITHEPRIPIPKDPSHFLMARIRTRSKEQPGWRKSVDVYLRMSPNPSVVGIEREVGAFVLDRDIQGNLVTKNVELGGTYQGLQSEQRRLVDDWFRRFNEMTRRNIDAEEGYDNLPLSTRTTFEGVTHALMESTLSDGSGRDLGLAIDLVDRVEAVHGRVHGAGGDQQFRIYVVLKPNAVKTLAASQQFRRDADNTVYHKGYPINYRQQGRVPTIQISIAFDKRRADIDVDYRSAKFPGALVNGHLSSSNSDVRVGSNHSRHVSRWQGFADWWRGLFGLPFVSELVGTIDPEERLIPAVPRRGKGKLEEAVEDWLAAWFIDNRPEQAVAYLTQSSFACMDVWSKDNPVDYGIAPLMMLDSMVSASKAVGKIQNLGQIVKPEILKDTRLRPLKGYQGSDLFALYEVPYNLALEFDCASRDRPRFGAKVESDKYGKYFASVFRLHPPSGRKGGRVILLWAKEGKYWRIVSYEVDPGVHELAEVPDTRPSSSYTRQKMVGNPELLVAVDQFGKFWGTGEIDKALEYFAPQSLGCVKFYLDGEPVTDDVGARNRLRQGLEDVYKAFRQSANIEDFSKPVEFVHPDIRDIDHPKADRYSLAGLPDYMGEAYSCAVRPEDVSWESPVNKRYGNYYAMAIQFDLLGEDPAVLYLIWGKVKGAWKITAFMVVTP